MLYDWTVYLAPKRRLVLLSASSLVFYGIWDWRFCGLLMASALFNHFAALEIDKTPRVRRRKLFLIFVVFTNLIVLGAFKYLDFFVNSLNDLLFRLGYSEVPYFLELVLPIGISFYTFQALSYVVDVYRGEISASKDASETVLFIVFFPQLIAGPIVRASSMIPQIRAKTAARTTPQKIAFGVAVVMITSGLFKKVVMANYLSTEIVEEVFFDPASYGALDLLLAAYGYTVQIYCDFSGYSDMAIGLSAMFGFVIPVNFDRPFRAASMRDFWRRWHISLSSWLRDYLFIPLGGSRGSIWLTRRNIFLTMILGGLWHGASWTFVIWGALHGAFLIGEYFVRAHVAFRIPRWIRIFLVFHFVVLTFIIFRIESLPLLGDYLSGFERINVPPEVGTPFLAGLVIFGFSVHFLPRLDLIAVRFVQKLPWSVIAIGSALAVTLIAGISPTGVTPFIYFQF